MKTKLKNIESLDEIKAGDILAREGNKYKVLAKVGLLIWLSYEDDFDIPMGSPYSLKDLQKGDFQLEVPDITWRPEEGEYFYHPTTAFEDGYVKKIFNSYVPADCWMAQQGLAFKTKEEAIAVAKKMLEAINTNNQ